MTLVQQGGSFYRTIPLHDRAEHQAVRELSLDDVPDMAENAVVAGVTPRSIRYDAGLESWWVDPRDKAKILAYVKRREPSLVAAGASPLGTIFQTGSRL